MPTGEVMGCWWCPSGLWDLDLLHTRWAPTMRVSPSKAPSSSLRQMMAPSFTFGSSLCISYLAEDVRNSIYRLRVVFPVLPESRDKYSPKLLTYASNFGTVWAVDGICQ